MLTDTAPTPAPVPHSRPSSARFLPEKSPPEFPQNHAYTQRATETRAVPPADRAGAVADAFSLAAAGKVGMGVALDMASKLTNDPDNLVRQTVVSSLVGLISLYSQVLVV